MGRSVVRKNVRAPLNHFAQLVLVAIAGLLAGCASKEFSGVAEYKQITAQALAAVQASLHSLDKVTAQPSPCPPKVSDAFCCDVQRLEVDSIQMREHAQAILARGDAYFASWSECIARIKDPKVRQCAERFHPELEQSFSKIKLASQQAGAAFKPFMAGLHGLRAKLEINPREAESETTKEMIRNTRDQGQQVVRQLEAINAELRKVTTMLTPAKGKNAQEMTHDPVERDQMTKE